MMLMQNIFRRVTQSLLSMMKTSPSDLLTATRTLLIGVIGWRTLDMLRDLSSSSKFKKSIQLRNKKIMEILLFIIALPFILMSILLVCIIFAVYQIVQDNRDYQETRRVGNSDDD